MATYTNLRLVVMFF